MLAVFHRTKVTFGGLPYMQRSKRKQVDRRPTKLHLSLAKAVAHEDIQLGDFITMLESTAEWPSFLWCADSALLPPSEPIRIRTVPRDAGVPVKVKSVCLPFVLVKHPNGRHQTLDVRRCRLARLDRRYAKATWKAR